MLGRDGDASLISEEKNTRKTNREMLFGTSGVVLKCTLLASQLETFTHSAPAPNTCCRPAIGRQATCSRKEGSDSGKLPATMLQPAFDLGALYPEKSSQGNSSACGMRHGSGTFPFNYVNAVHPNAAQLLYGSSRCVRMTCQDRMMLIPCTALNHGCHNPHRHPNEALWKL